MIARGESLGTRLAFPPSAAVFIANVIFVPTVLCCRSFEVELSYVPVEEPTAIIEKRERCFSR